jgi:3-deoxy-7-phosphoheptulonate synthase
MLKKIFKKISNIRITNAESMAPPIAYIERHEVAKTQSDFIVESRKTIANIVSGKDKRLLVIIGPCSIHDTDVALEYAKKLANIKNKFKDEIFIVMRVYFEKPRTTVGWKGLIFDPDLDNSCDMEKGLGIARKLLLELAKMKIPTATEYLDVITPQYFSDLVSWGEIGARTTESQTHRELASGLSCPVGFKNGTDGGVQVAIDAVIAASNSHMFWSINKKGLVYRYTTTGNPSCHIILRGGKDGTNYESSQVETASQQLEKSGLPPRLMVDFSHANSQEDFKNQLKVAQDVAFQITQGSDLIFGVMVESNINEGNQSVSKKEQLKYGVSITDACIDWEDSEGLLETLANAVKTRKNAR